MSETQVYSTTITSEPCPKKKHRHHHAPHDAMVGSITGFVIVSIIMNGLFPYVWWAFIPQIATFVHMIKEIANYSKNKELRNSYIYATTGNEVVSMWVGFVIVSIVMNSLFIGVWFASIPVAALLIQAIVKSIEYGKTKNQSKQENQATPNPITITVDYKQPEQPIYDSLIPNREEQSGLYCPMCGTPHKEDSSFCPACGTKL
jgi:hypothetical protein